MLPYLKANKFYEYFIFELLPVLLMLMFYLSPLLIIAFILAMINPKLDFILALRNYLVRKKPKKEPSRVYTLIWYIIIYAVYFFIFFISIIIIPVEFVKRIGQ